MSKAYFYSLLGMSPLTAGITPLNEITRVSRHEAVLLDGEPLFLTGPAGNDAAEYRAQALSAHPMVKQVLSALSMAGTLSVGSVDGMAIDWPSKSDVIVDKASFQAHQRDERPTMSLYLINLTGAGEISTLMSLTTELAQILEPNAPDLHSGDNLDQLITLVRQQFQRH